MKRIVIVTAFLCAAISLTYAIWLKITLKSRILDTEISTARKFQRISTQEEFPHPTEKELKRFTRDSCRNIAYQLDSNSYSDNDYGNLSRECAILILNTLAKNVPDGKSLSEYFSGKND